MPALDQDQTPVGAVGPVVQAPGAHAGDLRERGGERLLDPDRLAGPRLEGLDQAHAVGRIQDPVHEDRRGSQVAEPPGPRDLEVGIGLRSGGIHSRPPPKDLDVGDVLPIDLVERRVSGERLVTAVIGPPLGLGGSADVGRAGFEADQAHQKDRSDPSRQMRHDQIPPVQGPSSRPLQRKDTGTAIGPILMGWWVQGDRQQGSPGAPRG